MFDADFLFDGDSIKKVKLSISELKMLRNVDQITVGQEDYRVSLIKYSVDDKDIEIWLDEVEE